MILFLDLKVVNIQYKLIEGIKKMSKYHDYYHIVSSYKGCS